jgi:hypothetical protein
MTSGTGRAELAGTDDPFAQVIGATALGAGAIAVVAPGPMAHAFGVTASRETRLLVRMWGLGSAQAGLELVLADSPVRTRLLAVAAAVDACACAFALRAGLPKRATAMLATTFGLVAATAAAGLATDCAASTSRRP